jgi:lipopolysaccharide/colanic/teichoic acid biosynthesis glycosyltransferase
MGGVKMAISEQFSPALTTLSSEAQTMNALPTMTAFEWAESGDKEEPVSLSLQNAGKRLMDVTLASIGLVMLLPVLCIIAVLIKFDSKGPILYKSLRIGKDQKPFYMMKFRTMVADADAQREKLRQQANLEGNLFKLANDPRITPLGQFLRKLSLDELPQLINVIKGEMSLVGPRPLPPDESALFEDPYTARFEVLPGITGLWQVSGRSKLNFRQLCELEFSYVRDWSLWRDIEILCKTVPVVLCSRGAY